MVVCSYNSAQFRFHSISATSDLRFAQNILYGSLPLQSKAVAYLRVGLVGPRPHQVRRCPTICGHILGYYTVNHQVPCHIIDCLTYTITTGSLVVVIA